MSGVGTPLGGGGIRQLTGVVLAGPGTGSQATTFANGSTGSGAVVLASSPTITTPTIASFLNANHNHQNSAGGGSLDAAAIGSGSFAAARLPTMVGADGVNPGVQGAVPAPAATDNVNFLRGDGTWQAGFTGTIAHLIVNGTAGNGYVELANQSSAPGTPTLATRLYVDSTNRLSWRGTNGFIRTFDGTANSADRVYVLPDAGGTVVLDTAIQTLTNKTLTTPVISITDAATNTVTNITEFDHLTSGTPAANFGTAVLWRGHTSNNTLATMARLRTIWTTATNGSQVANLIVGVWDTAENNLLTFTTAQSQFTKRVVINAGDASNAWLQIKTDGNTNIRFMSQASSSIKTDFLQGSSGNGSILDIDPTPSDGTSIATLRFFRNVNTSGRVSWDFCKGNATATLNHSLAGTGDSYIAGDNGKLGVGTTTPGTTLHANTTDAVTNAATNVATISHALTTANAGAAGIGAVLLFSAADSTSGIGASVTQADITTSWVVATHASRTARVIFNVYDTAAREGLRLEASGSAPMIGFLGASAIVRQTDGAALTNNVTVGGTTDQIDDFSDLTTYSNSAATIRNDIYQLARKLKIVDDALRLYGLLT